MRNQGTQTVNGFEFPAGPGPGPRGLTEQTKWKRIVTACEFMRSQLGLSDRAFYRQLIGLESMARANLRDRTGLVADLAEPALEWEPESNGPFGLPPSPAGGSGSCTATRPSSAAQ